MFEFLFYKNSLLSIAKKAKRRDASSDGSFSFSMEVVSAKPALGLDEEDCI